MAGIEMPLYVFKKKERKSIVKPFKFAYWTSLNFHDYLGSNGN